MKQLLILLASVLMLSNTSTAQERKAAILADGAMMEFNSTTMDYGTISQNSEPLRVFEFKNTGTAPLMIVNAKGSCGCTVPTYPKEPILPGAQAEIEVRYDTKRLGVFSKTVTLTTNAVNGSEDQPDGTFVLTIKGKVNEAAPGENPVELLMTPR